MERHDDDDGVHVYQEENEGHQNLSFIVSDGAGLVELATHDVEIKEEEPGQRNAFENQNDLLKNKKEVNDLMHVSLKQIQMLMTFDKYNLLLSIYIYILKYVIKEINLLFFKCVHMFHHKSKGKGRKGDSSSSSQACSASSTDLFAVMVLLNF
jgi:hypothetical protein